MWLQFFFVHSILGIIICAFIILPWFFAIDDATQGVFLQKAFNEDVFGAPTFVVNNKIFWGQDRLEYALDEYNS